ncbi:MAG: NAD(P)/FAD-dependent oxidoreductase [Gammaproteobacteria bacterium]|nr:MAG: NAD(P)/FAD-dependent oxidoreductase [Gammaproteobacteria bacterium]
MKEAEFDVVIIGAGLSGIGMACHLQRETVGKRVAILERRNAIGGTWDLFRYPGVRSDSDMFTMSYDFRPWMAPRVLARGEQICEYIVETARENDVLKNIEFGVKVTAADWSSERQHWTVSGIHEASGQPYRVSCRFLICCAGYYDYDQGYLPDFPGIGDFAGQCIHPQFWPQDLDYRGKKVVVIGSGATAVTLIPAMAEDCAHITMLQRSPSYYLSVPGYGKWLRKLESFLPRRWLYHLVRLGNIGLQRFFYRRAIRNPQGMRRFLLGQVRKALGPEVDMRHFTPGYNPWEQRLCVVPNGDLFRVIKAGKASVVTGDIETFTERGIRLTCGAELEADIVITATGLQLKTCGGMQLRVDGVAKPVKRLLSYKAVLMQDLPNLGIILGYVNASWTLKADIAAHYLCRLINHMDKRGLTSVTPRAPAGETSDENAMNALSAGYIQRGKGELPRQGRQLPWRVSHDYEVDRRLLLDDPIEDQSLEFYPT